MEVEAKDEDEAESDSYWMLQHEGVKLEEDGDNIGDIGDIYISDISVEVMKHGTQ